MRVAVANLAMDRPGDRLYVWFLRVWLIIRSRGRGVLFLVENGHGLDSTRIRGVMLRVKHRKAVVVGDVGAHRGVARARRRLGRKGPVVWLFSAHGLHVRTQGEAAQLAYYVALAAVLQRLTDSGQLWIVAGDFNEKPDEIARWVGGAAYGAPGDVMGLVVSPGLRIAGAGFREVGKRRGWTDHAEVWADVVEVAA